MKPRILNLGFGFFFIFLLFHAVEQHIGAYFAETGKTALGIGIVTIGYFFLFVGNFISPILISRWGARKSLLIATVFYMAMCFFISIQALWLALFAAILGGISSALLWNTMQSYLMRTSTKDRLAINAGIVLAFYGVGAGIGLIAISAMLKSGLGYATSFQILLPVGIVALFCFSRIDGRYEVTQASPKDIITTYKNPTVLRLATISVSAFVAFGLLVTAVPLQIKEVLGDTWIGTLESGAFFILAICVVLGKQIYQLGRRLMLLIAYPLLVTGIVLLFVGSGKTAVITGTLFICAAFPILLNIMFTLVDCAPPHKLESANAVFTSADDITAFVFLLLATLGKSAEIPLSYLYLFALGTIAVSVWAIFPLLKGGRDLEEAVKRLERAFPPVS
jgi:MFS family permease